MKLTTARRSVMANPRSAVPVQHTRCVDVVKESTVANDVSGCSHATIWLMLGETMVTNPQDECVWTTKTDWRRAVSRNEANSLRQRVEELEEQLQRSREPTAIPHHPARSTASHITPSSFPSDPSTSTSEGRTMGNAFPPPHQMGMGYQPAFLPQQYYPAYSLDPPYLAAGPSRPQAPHFNEHEYQQGRAGMDPSMGGYHPPHDYGSRPVGGEQNGHPPNVPHFTGPPQGQSSKQPSTHSASPWTSHSSSGNQRRGSDPPEDIEDLMVCTRWLREADAEVQDVKGRVRLHGPQSAFRYSTHTEPASDERPHERSHDQGGFARFLPDFPLTREQHDIAVDRFFRYFACWGE